jgi:redox-sensitive bicupin YhaK (pirin superfamily)
MSTARVEVGERSAAGTSSVAPRRIEGIYAPPGLHWVGDGFWVAGYFSAIRDAARKLSPFLLLDYAPAHDFAPSERPRGVGVHPHRGFETVTIAFQGSVAHHDSAGGGGIIGPGDAQWMTAASGILHKEYHEQGYSRRGGPFQVAQLWVNLPRRHKSAPPRYQPILAGEWGVATLPDGAGHVRVLAGEYAGARGPAKTFTPIQLYDVRLNAKGAADFTLPARDNAALLVMKGDVALGVERARAGDFVVFDNVGDAVRVEAGEDEAQLLVMSGEPIDEPVVQYGPFVMNTRQEIVEAFEDLERGKFGHLED